MAAPSVNDSDRIANLQRRIRQMLEAGKLKRPYRLDRKKPPHGESFYLASDTIIEIEPELYDLYVADLKANTDPTIQ